MVMGEDLSEDRAEHRPLLSTRGVALLVYVLYLVGFLTGFTALLGLIIAYVKVGQSDPVTATHFRFQIRTFWMGLVYFIAGWMLIYVLIGLFILLWWLLWTLIRIIKGLLLLNDGRPIHKPRSFFFG